MTDSQPLLALAGLRVLDLTAEMGSLATRSLPVGSGSYSRSSLPAGHPIAAARLSPETCRIPNAASSGFSSTPASRASRSTSIATMAALCFAARGRFGPADRVAACWQAGRIGLDTISLACHRPDLIQLSLSPFGQDGPYARYAGTDLIEMAMGGLMYLCGDPDRRPRPHHRGTGLRPGGRPGCRRGADRRLGRARREIGRP